MAQVVKRQSSGIYRMERNWGILFALPAILGFLIFTVGPMIASLFYSLTDWTIGGDMHFIGLENYITLFRTDDLFRKSLFSTTYYSLGSVPIIIIVGFFIAMLLNQKVKGLPIFRTIFYLPVIVPSIANSMLWLWLFNPDFGLFNTILKELHLPTSQWIYDEKTAIPSLILMSSWGVGNIVVIFLAGLQGVPTHLYEAVEIDGGNSWHKLLHVTIPMMTPTIFFNLIMSLIGMFQEFNMAYIMTQGGPNNSTLMYVFYLYRKAFMETKIGYACALAWILFLFIMILTFIVFKSSKGWVYYEGGDR
ncbi:carbohydrate ABC transporter permease [Neobacillus cucumis]|uniref:ABC transporter permease n=1 Tax=Neobacillus cucumis TaxID=1740721 RepID=A0A2N5H6C0_9BACI|nr:sugar ABC transporter permease [Neobacillus cucumis]PLS01054.1 ABC transporter permease [Neobacillus cucumis]